MVRDGYFTRKVKKKKLGAEKVPAQKGRPAAKKVPAKKVPAKRGRPAKKVVPAQKKERPVRKKAAPPQRKDTETEVIQSTPISTCTSTCTSIASRYTDLNFRLYIKKH